MQNLPSWLQAFAALVAIVISVLAFVRGSAAERRRDHLQSRGIAVAVYPELLKLETVVQSARENVDMLQESGRERGLVGQSVAYDLQRIARVESPPMLERNIDRLFMLGKVAGPRCLELMSVLQQHNDLVDQIAARVAVMNSEQWLEEVGHIDGHFNVLDRVISKCKDEVKPIQDAAKG